MSSDLFPQLYRMNYNRNFVLKKTYFSEESSLKECDLVYPDPVDIFQ